MTRPVDRVWLCAIDLDRWSDVSRLVPRGHHTSARLPRAARIAAVTSNALVSVAVHELAAPEIARGSEVAYGGGAESEPRPLDQVHYSVSYNDQAIAVATSLAPVGIEIESAEEEEIPEARTRVRDRAARKAHPGGIELGDHLTEAGRYELDDTKLWVTDIEWHIDFAIALASVEGQTPQVISTTASTILDRWRDTVEGVDKPSEADEGRAHRSRFG